MKTLHIDTGKTMQGGQWQVLYLVERLQDAKLITRCPEMATEMKHGPIDFVEDTGAAHKWADLVHAHDARAHSLALFMNTSRHGKRPIVVSRRVAFPVKRSIISRWKYGRATMYLAVSQFVRDRLIEAGVEEGIVKVVHDGVHVPVNPTTREPNRVVALASKPLQLPNIPIHLTTNLWQDLAIASIFVYRSEMEGLGSAALAAMACGVPVIASNVGGLPEAVEHERTGLLVDNDNFEPAIQRLLRNPKEAEEMGMRGRERVERNFTIDQMVEKTKQAYQEVLR